MGDKGQPGIGGDICVDDPPARSIRRRLASAASPSPKRMMGRPAMRWNRGGFRSWKRV
jgi:hypothetical protein